MCETSACPGVVQVNEEQMRILGVEAQYTGPYVAVQGQLVDAPECIPGLPERDPGERVVVLPRSILEGLLEESVASAPRTMPL